MKNKGLIIFLIILLFICCFLLGGILYLGLSNRDGINFNFGFSQRVSNELIFEKTYEDIFEKINITSGASNIEIKESNDDTSKILIYGDKDLLNINDQKSLNIEYKYKSCIGICFNNRISRIEIYLPEEFNDEIIINNKYGDISVDRFNNSKIDIDSSYGDVRIKGAYEAKVKTSAGDVKIDYVTKAIVDNNYGDIKITDVLSYLDINNDCGDIEINSVNLDTNSTINNNLGDIKIRKTNDIRIDASTSLGDEKVENNNYKSDIVLKITNSCGDIKVNN